MPIKTSINYSPNFCKMYGYYNVILDKFTYDVSDDNDADDDTENRDGKVGDKLGKLSSRGEH